MRQAVEVTRSRTVGGTTTVEVAYAVTSLKATAGELLQLSRGHWGIENELHYVRDVTLREDACRVRSGSAPQVLAGLRNAAIHLLKDVGAKSLPEAIERLQIRPDDARKLIGIPPSE